MISSASTLGFLVGLSALNLLVLAASVAVLLRTRRRIRRIRKAHKAVRRQVTADKRLRISTWRQIEALVSLYRLLDGKVDLPPTRFGPVSPDFLLHVIAFIRRHEPRIIVECGSGTSTIVLAHLLKSLGIDSHIYAIENFAPSIDTVRQHLRQHNLERFVTIIAVPLVEKRYDGFETAFRWYDLDSNSIPAQIDLLIVDGPQGMVNRYARYPAGPELLPKLSRNAHVFIDDANRPDEKTMVRLWQESRPELGLRTLAAEKGCSELFFLDEAKPAAEWISVRA
jgi:hypothetical protein